MLNLFDIPMHDREGFIEALERLEEKQLLLRGSFWSVRFPALLTMRRSTDCAGTISPK